MAALNNGHFRHLSYVVPIPDSQSLGLETVDRYLYALDTFVRAMYQTVSDITTNTSSYVSVRPGPSSGNTILEHVYFWTASTNRFHCNRSCVTCSNERGRVTTAVFDTTSVTAS